MTNLKGSEYEDLQECIYQLQNIFVQSQCLSLEHDLKSFYSNILNVISFKQFSMLCSSIQKPRRIHCWKSKVVQVAILSII